jgi:two-component system CitB family sensor kinase
VCNDQAARLLGVSDAVGHTLDDLHLPADFRALVRGNGTEQQLLLNGRVVFIDVRTVSRDGAHLGRVVIVRDRTDVEALSRKLDAVNAMTTALRVQRHEFANRLHAISGLIATGEHDQAERYLADVLNHGPLKYPVEHADRLTEPYLQAFLGAKGVEASEKGVLLTIGAETLVTGHVVAAEDVTTVLGNLIDNAVAAAVAGRTTPAWVEVEVLDDGGDLYLSVMDSGNGVDALEEDGDRAAPDPDAVHGLGFGLPLSRDIARRSGGDLWLASRGVPGEHGAVFCVRMPGAVEPARPDNSSEGTP